METGKQEYWTTVFRREQLLELLEGRGPWPKSDNRLTAVRHCSKTDLVGIWTAARAKAFSPLPQVIVGTDECLGDLFAWSGTYLRELGPISGLVRTMTLAQFDSALTRSPPKELWEIAGAAVGIVIGEVWCRGGPRIRLEDAATATPNSTLSYAMMRSWALGYRTERSREVFDEYVKAAQMLGHPLQENIAQSVLDVVGTVVGAGGARKDEKARISVVSGWWELLRGSVDVYELLPEVLSYPRDLFGARDVEGIRGKTAEERVQFFDVLAPKLAKESEKSGDGSAAFALALSAFVCRPGFFQQATLLREFAERMPEAILWLGALQMLSPLADTLLLQSGAGWRIARELDRPGDAFSVPNSEACMAELEKLSLAKSRTYRGLVQKPRVDVEIYPMIVSTFRGMKESPAGRGPSEREHMENILMESRLYLEKLSLLEVRLHEALHIVQDAQRANAGKNGRRGGGRKR